MTTFDLSTVEAFSIDGNRLDLRCRPRPLRPHADGPEFDATIPVSVRFLTPTAAHVTVRPSPETTSADVTPLDLDYEVFDTDPALEVDDSGVDGGGDGPTGTLEVATAAVRLRVDLDDATLALEDRETGETIVETPSSVTDIVGKPDTPPLGFTEESADNGPLRVTDTHVAVRLRPDEGVYGLGEQLGTVDHRGRRVTARVTQPYGVPDERTHAPVPFYLSDRGYGLLVDTPTDATFDLGAGRPGTASVAVPSDVLSFVVFADGTPADVLSSYTDLAGRARSLPAWAFGVWMSRNSYESADEVRSVVDDLRERGFPLDVVHLDPGWMQPDRWMELEWDPESFPDPEGFVADMHDRGVHVSLWEYSHIPAGTDRFDEALEGGYLVGNGHGRPALFRRERYRYERFGLVDFTDPDAVEWWRDHHRRLLADGVDAFKTDFGEYLPSDAVTSDRRSGTASHNTYPVAQQEAVAGAFEDVDRPPVFFSRAGWVGGQRHPVHWGGDPEPTFEGFAASVRGGLSLLTSGYQFWSCDIGGYAGEPTPRVYARWAQWGLIALSNPRFHGRTAREPDHFGEEAAAVVHEYARLRSRLMPYHLGLAAEAVETGVPSMRPMVVEFPDHRPTRDATAQHMVGDALLVAPVLTATGDVTVELPPGEWVDFHTGERHEGPTTLDRTVPLDVLPMYVRAGRPIPVQDPTDRVRPSTPSSLALRLHLRSGRTDATRSLHDRDRGRLVDVRVVVDADRERVTVETEAPPPAFDLVVPGWTGSAPRVAWDGRPVDADRVEVTDGELRVSR